MTIPHESHEIWLQSEAEVMVLSYQIILWLAKPCMSAVQWQDGPILLISDGLGLIH